MSYLLLTTKFNPNLVVQIVRESFEGIRGGVDMVNISGFEPGGMGLELSPYPETTGEFSVLLQGKAQASCDRIFMDGDRQRMVDVSRDGTFETRIILRAG